MFKDLLTGEERVYAHLCDKLECLIWCYEEAARGNRGLDGWVEYYQKWLKHEEATLPHSIRDLAACLRMRAPNGLPRLRGVEALFMGAERV